MKIEKAQLSDAAELLEIYAPYVTNTAISFEYEVPSLEEFSQRIADISAQYPYLKAVEEGRILGYAYATAFKWRAAYDWSVETTIYLRPEARGRGIGRALYQQLERSLSSMGILNMNACIGIPGDPEDTYVNYDSQHFHEAMGFQMVGTFHHSGYKLGRWHHMIWMEKMLAPHTAPATRPAFGQWTL